MNKRPHLFIDILLEIGFLCTMELFSFINDLYFDFFSYFFNMDDYVKFNIWLNVSFRIFEFLFKFLMYCQDL